MKIVLTVPRNQWVNDLLDFWKRVLVAYGAPEHLLFWGTIYSAIKVEESNSTLVVEFNGRRHSLVASPVINALVGGLQYLEDQGWAELKVELYESQEPTMAWWHSSSNPDQRVYQCSPENYPLNQCGLTEEEILHFGLIGQLY